MSQYDELLARLAERARHETVPDSASAPSSGFATRVLAEARATRVQDDEAWLWARWALRAVPAAAALLLLCALLAPHARATAPDLCEQIANDFLNAALKP
jgi:hypothetical protein